MIDHQTELARLRTRLTREEVTQIAAELEMVAVHMLVKRGITGYVPRRKHLAQQMLIEIAERESLSAELERKDKLLEQAREALPEVCHQLREAICHLGQEFRSYSAIVQEMEDAIAKGQDAYAALAEAAKGDGSAPQTAASSGVKTSSR